MDSTFLSLVLFLVPHIRPHSFSGPSCLPHSGFIASARLHSVLSTPVLLILISSTCQWWVLNLAFMTKFCVINFLLCFLKRKRKTYCNIFFSHFTFCPKSLPASLFVSVCSPVPPYNVFNAFLVYSVFESGGFSLLAFLMKTCDALHFQLKFLFSHGTVITGGVCHAVPRWRMHSASA